ncbi:MULTISPECIES: NADPH-dependent FMN reductase [unclassified Lysobacter]
MTNIFVPPGHPDLVRLVKCAILSTKTSVSVPVDFPGESVRDSSDAGQPGKRILAIAGSLRRGSWNLRLLEAAAESAPAGMTVSVYYDLASIPLFNEDLEQETDGGPEVVQRIRRDVAAADGLLIATPEYNQSIPGVLKNTLDWLSRAAPDEVLAGKPVAIIGASGGRWGTRLSQQALRQTLYATESLVMPAPALFVRDVTGVFDATGRLTDIPTRRALEEVLASFANWIDRVAPP